MSDRADRLYDLLPSVYRSRDAEQGYPLRALLQVAAEEVNRLEDDIAQLYENWFVETCQEWAVPYIGRLIGYEPVHGGPLGQGSEPGRDAFMAPRAEVANTIRFRRRKGTFGILSELAGSVAGWPARAVESQRLLAITQSLNHLRPDRGHTVELHDEDPLERIGGAFDTIARNVDVRRVGSARGAGRSNIAELGLFVWRLRSYPVTRSPAYCYEEEAPNCFLFSPLGNDIPLFTRPEPGAPLPDLTVPAAIRRRPFETRLVDTRTGRTESGISFYWGADKSLAIWLGSKPEPFPADRIVAADLADWSYRPLPGWIAVDPERGRMMFPPGQPRKQQVSVSYGYGFSADIGGGEYDRPMRQPAGATIYRVGNAAAFARIGDALARWQAEAPPHAVIEIADSGVYTEPLRIELAGGQVLHLRAANRTRPVIRLLDWQTSYADGLSIRGEAGSWFVLDGVTVVGRGLQVEGEISGVAIRHSTIVPGWGLDCHCAPRRPAEPSIELVDAPLCLTVERSITGAIRVDRASSKHEPIQIRIADSILDATGSNRVALGAEGRLCAFTALTLLRSTVFGQVQTHTIDLAENSIVTGTLLACRRQVGCVRFCYVPHGSRTPRRYACQPDLVEQAVAARFPEGPVAEREAVLATERLRVEPQFNSTRYGRPTYAQLAASAAPEIGEGAEDGSEMGAFHHLYQPQRATNLRTRLSEYLPAGTDSGIIFAS